jgi:hypothetical protein
MRGISAARKEKGEGAMVGVQPVGGNECLGAC